MRASTAQKPILGAHLTDTNDLRVALSTIDESQILQNHFVLAATVIITVIGEFVGAECDCVLRCETKVIPAPFCREKTANHLINL